VEVDGFLLVEDFCAEESEIVSLTTVLDFSGVDFSALDVRVFVDGLCVGLAPLVFGVANTELPGSVLLALPSFIPDGVSLLPLTEFGCWLDGALGV
jgi:hypothetical protein